MSAGQGVCCPAEGGVTLSLPPPLWSQANTQCSSRALQEPSPFWELGVTLDVCLCPGTLWVASHLQNGPGDSLLLSSSTSCHRLSPDPWQQSLPESGGCPWAMLLLTGDPV